MLIGGSSEMVGKPSEAAASPAVEASSS